MSVPRRVKRPPMERKRPIRSPTTLFGVPGPTKSAPKRSRERPAGRDAVEDSIAVGYQIIDEYLHRGRSAAESNHPASAPPSSDGRSTAESTSKRLMRYASDVSSAWMEVLTNGGASRAATAPVSGAAGPFQTGKVARDARPTSASAIGDEALPIDNVGHGTLTPVLTVDICAPGRAEVAIDLKPVWSGERLLVHDLRDAEAKVPRIGGVNVQVTGDRSRVVFQLAVPQEQPAGVYSGLIVGCESNLPIGSLTVRWHGRPGGR
jgi:hypothetical protein